ncbi:MAG: ATP-binding cassette domain-containing protein [Dehalococcoidia bacterium]
MNLDRYSVVAEELSKRFGNFIAVDRVSFKVERGEIFGFLGPNGSGKTTTIRMLLGLLRPTRGRAWVLGYNATRQPYAIRHRIGYVSQRFALYEDLTVGQNLEFYGRTYGLSNERLRNRKETTLELTGLNGSQNDLAKDLAGGWKRRLALGVAIIHQPELLFLDEPTAGVDPISRHSFWDLLYELAEGGTTIFVTTHYMDEAECCHRLAFIDKGKLVAQGTLQSLKDRMSGQILEIDCSQPDVAIRGLQEMRLFQEVALYGNLIHVTVQDTEGHRLLIEERLRQKGVQIRSMEVVPPSLEDVFISSMERG